MKELKLELQLLIYHCIENQYNKMYKKITKFF